MRVGIIGGGFGLNVQAPIIQTHPMPHKKPFSIKRGAVNYNYCFSIC